MLGFLCALVQAGVFQKVKVSFLMIGHTHEDIDQLFSRFSVWLKHNCVLTLDQLLLGFENCYKPKPTAIQMNTVFDFKKWLELNNIKNHSKPHIFRIVKINGKAEINYKKWSTDKEWISVENNLLKDSMSLMDPINKIIPTMAKIDERVKHDIQTVAKFFKDDNVSSWWSKYFMELQSDEEKNREAGKQLLLDLLKLNVVEEMETTVNTDDEVLEGLENINALIPKVNI